MKLLLVPFAVLLLGGCDTSTEDHRAVVNACAWTRDLAEWNMCVERANDRIEARRAREDAVIGGALSNWANTPRSCMNIGGIVTCQ